MKSNIDRLERPQQLYRIPRECGREYIGKTSRPLKIRITEYKYNLRREHFDKSKLASHASVGGHNIDRTNKTTLQFEPNCILGSTKRQRICYVYVLTTYHQSDNHYLPRKATLINGCRSQWPRGLKRGSAVARLLGLWFRIPPAAWMSVSCECCM